MLLTQIVAFILQDLTKFHSVKTGRGPLGADWKVSTNLLRNVHYMLFE
jgi:hypothetical protein